MLIKTLASIVLLFVLFPVMAQDPTPTLNSLFGLDQSVISNKDWEPYIIERAQNISIDVNGQSFEIELVLVPKGAFRLGAVTSSASDSDETVASDLQDEQRQNFNRDEDLFYIMKYEVRNELIGNSIDPDLPATDVTWVEAEQYCRQWNGMLPSEAQWEYVARGPESWFYPWGVVYIDDIVADQVLPTDNETRGESWVGAHHMVGNVSEWTSSKYQPYPILSIIDITDRENPENDGSARSVRGGSFRTPTTTALARYGFPPTASSPYIGFRCIFAYDTIQQSP